MEHCNYPPKRKKYKHILEEDRYVIERMLNAKQETSVILEVIGCSERTLKREIERGKWQYLGDSAWETQEKYSWDVAQRKHEESASNKGRYPKINDTPELRAYLENKMKKEHFSPKAAIFAAKNR